MNSTVQSMFFSQEFSIELLFKTPFRIQTAVFFTGGERSPSRESERGVVAEDGLCKHVEQYTNIYVTHTHIYIYSIYCVYIYINIRGAIKSRKHETNELLGWILVPVMAKLQEETADFACRCWIRWVDASTTSS